MTKEEIKNRIAELLLLEPAENPPMSTGSTEPRRIFELIDEKFELSIDPDNRLTKPQLAEAIVNKSGHEWHAGCESRGGTVTKIGLLKVLTAVYLFKQFNAVADGLCTPAQLGIENDYARLRNNNPGIEYEYAIAALLMPPRQLDEFRNTTLAGHSKERVVNEICDEIDPTPINTHCVPGLVQTDDHRYVQCFFQSDEEGPSDIIVRDLRAPDAKVGISIKHGRTNKTIKNASPVEGLEMTDAFMNRWERELRRITPDWVREMSERFGPLQYYARGGNNWKRKQAETVINYLDELGTDAMDIFNRKCREDRLRLTRSMLHLDHNPYDNFYIVTTHKTRRLGYFIDRILRQHHNNFACYDPIIERAAGSRVSKRIFDRAGLDPINLNIQIKLNRGLAEHGFDANHLARDPNSFFEVRSGAETHVLKYGSLKSWNISVTNDPSERFWEYVYES